ncbi:MAG: hypothetical protein ACI8PZ_000223 [Myxococcota bacterium]|jgi:hypothetical protein
MRPGALTTIGDALATIVSWEGDERARHLARASDLDDQIARLHEQVIRLTEQLAGLRNMREEMHRAADDAATGVSGRGHGLMFEVLERQASVIALRAREVLHARAERYASLEYSLRNSDAAPLVHEYEQFINTVAPTLERLPESYRSVMLAHHLGVSERLRNWVGDWLAGHSEVSDDPIPADICYAHDAPEGEPAVLVVLLPVDGRAVHEWQEREEDIQLALAARVVQALYESLAETGLVGADVVSGSHAGLLVLEVDVTGADPRLPEVFEERFAQVSAECRDWHAAGLRPAVHRVPVDYVFPPVAPADEEEAFAPVAVFVAVGGAHAG